MAPARPATRKLALRGRCVARDFQIVFRPPTCNPIVCRRVCCIICRVTGGQRKVCFISPRMGFLFQGTKLLPKRAFAALWAAALSSPADLLTMPFTADLEQPARCFPMELRPPADADQRGAARVGNNARGPAGSWPHPLRQGGAEELEARVGESAGLRSRGASAGPAGKNAVSAAATAGR
jgi:hypothetical protein